jgi:two-component system cell cycle sensor histidine kinase/response regulator CckA
MALFASLFSRVHSRPITLKSHLLKLILVGVLPLLIFSIGMVVLLARQERAALKRGLVETTRALTVALDKEFESSITALKGLATSEHLGIGDVVGFYDVTSRMLQSQTQWKKIIFLDSSGKQLFSTGSTTGATIPGVVETETFDETLRTGRPAVSNLFAANSIGASVSIYVPVLRGNKVKFVVTAVLEPRVFMDILAQQKIPGDWVGTVLDRKKIIVARTRSQEQFVGKPAGPLIGKTSDQVTEGWLESSTRRDGVPSYAAYSRSLSSGWSVALAVPAAEVDALFYRSLWTIGGAGVVFLLAGFLLALIFARRVSEPIRSLSLMAEALGKGQPIPRPVASSLAEVDSLAQDLELAADLLEKRSRERDKVETTLREKEESLQRHADLMELTGEAILGWEMEGPIVYWNHGAEKLYGFSRGEAIGRSSHEVFSTLFPGVELDLKPILAETGEWSGEVKHFTPDGRQLIVERHVRLVRERSGRALVLESNRDITSRKQFVQRLSTERAVTLVLSESSTLEEAMGRILQAIGEGLEWELGKFWIVNEKRQIIECLESWHTPPGNLSGREPTLPFGRGAGLPGKVWATEEPAWISDVDKDREFLRGSTAVKENLHGAFAFPIKLHNDVLGVIEFFSMEIREPDEDLLKMVQAMGDEIGQFVERMRAEAALRHSEDNLRQQAQELEQQLVASGRLVAMGELTASMAHEFNNPLGIIIGFAQGLLEDMEPPDPNYHHIEIIAEEAQRCEKILKELLEFGRPKNADFTVTDVKEVIEKTLDLVSSRATKSNVETISQIVGTLPQIHADAQQLQQVLLNLCLNAVDAMPRGGRLTVGAAANSADQLVITVTDTGYGIDADALPKIFQPFFTAKKRRGLGLGLPICDRIIKTHGGRIDVESQPGRGAIFTIHLPLNQKSTERKEADQELLAS